MHRLGRSHSHDIEQQGALGETVAGEGFVPMSDGAGSSACESDLVTPGKRYNRRIDDGESSVSCGEEIGERGHFIHLEWQR